MGLRVKEKVGSKEVENNKARANPKLSGQAIPAIGESDGRFSLNDVELNLSLITKTESRRQMSHCEVLEQKILLEERKFENFNNHVKANVIALMKEPSEARISKNENRAESNRQSKPTR
jgi:hypothetical protein